MVEIKDLPVFNKPADKQIPAEATEIAAKIEAADGVIIGTPEYDHSIPAVLMSALAWISYGVFPLLNKPVMITGASYGTLGSSRAQLQLRQILNAPEIKANVLPDEFLLSHSLQAFDQNGDLVDLDVIKKLDAIFDDFRVLLKLLRNCVTHKSFFAKMLKILIGKICKIGDRKNEICWTCWIKLRSII